MVHDATHVENNMGSEVELFFCSKDKQKTCFRWSAFMIDYISAYKSQMAFMGLDYEADKPIMNAELRVNWTKLKTIPRDMFIPENWERTSHVNEN